MKFFEASQPFSWSGFPFVLEDDVFVSLLFDSLWLLKSDFFLKPNLFGKILQLFFVFVSFCSSFLMLEHSFSRSKRRSLKFSFPSAVSPWRVSLLVRPKFPLWCCPFSRLSETKNHPDIDVRSLSCSKNRTWTITRRGNLSFCAAWVLASNDSFWQFINLQSCSRSESVSHGCTCNCQSFTLERSYLKQLDSKKKNNVEVHSTWFWDHCEVLGYLINSEWNKIK